MVRDISKLPNATTSHDCGSLSRVVMVRKTDQRLINHHVGQKKVRVGAGAYVVQVEYNSDDDVSCIF